MAESRVRKMQRIMKNEKGATIVEFAIIAPLLFVLIFGIIEFSLLFYNKAIITNATREAARNATLFKVSNPTLTDIDNQMTSTVNNYCSTYLISFDGNKLPIVNPKDGTPVYPVHEDLNVIPPGIINSGDYLSIKVDYDYKFLVFPNLIKLIKGSYTNTTKITSIARMRVE
jgi:Flp pilus assembly pilin Flp